MWPLNGKENVAQHSAAQNNVKPGQNDGGSHHPVIAQLRKLKDIYLRELQAIESLLEDCRLKFQKTYNIMTV